MSPKGTLSDVGINGPTEATKERMSSVVDTIVDGVDLQEDVSYRATDEKKEGEKQSKHQKGLDNPPPVEKTEEENEQKKEEQPEETEEAGKKEEASEETEETEEDLIPRSKVQERFDQMTAKIKELEAQVQVKQEPKPSDSQTEKLQKLSDDELKLLKRQVIKSQRTETDDTKLDQLLDLEEKISQTLATAPIRFQESQIKYLNQFMPEASKIDPLVSQQKGELWDIAKKIYLDSPSFQRSVTGQAEALNLAIKQYSSQKQTQTSKDQTSTLKQQVTTLKKKTSLDGKTLKANEAQLQTNKLKQKAMEGGDEAKKEFVKHALIPENFFED